MNIEKIKISIIIPTHNNKEILEKCLNSIKKYTTLDPIKIEIIVVSNGCGKDTIDYLNNEKNLKSFNNCLKSVIIYKQLSFAKACNIGMKEADGFFFILLNNDTELLEQKKDEWIKILLKPFKMTLRTAASGPLMKKEPYCIYSFLLFFCVMISREAIDKIGYLDESFKIGGGEDIDWCARAQSLGMNIIDISTWKGLENDNIIGSFPIFHKGSVTVNKISNWDKFFLKNMFIIAKRYNITYLINRLKNDNERAVTFRHHQVYRREEIRYKIAQRFAMKNKCENVLDIGCATGYGSRFFKNLEYTGIDDSEDAIIFSELEYEESPFIEFHHMDINYFLQNNKKKYDLIIAFEIIEHLKQGKKIANELLKHGKNVIITVPYNEEPGFWGKHHKLHHLIAKDFPHYQPFYLKYRDRYTNKFKILQSEENITQNEDLILLVYQEKSISS